MAHFKVPFLTCKPPAPGRPPRWFWEPSPKLRAEGYRTQRVPGNWDAYIDPATLEGAAIAAARLINEQVADERAAKALSEAGGRAEGLRERGASSLRPSYPQ